MNARPGHEAVRDAVVTHGVVSARPEDLLTGSGWRVAWAVVHEAVLRLWSDDAFGLAGNVAFRMLLAVFPFLIFTSSLTAFIGDRTMADDLIQFLIAIVPPALVDPIVGEVEKVMTIQRGGVLSIGILLTIWFAVGGVDGVRVGLNRAYGVRETRSAVMVYTVMSAFVLLSGLVLTLVGYLVVLAPRAGSLLHQLFPAFDPSSISMGLVRYPAAGLILLISLFAAHVFLPARRTRFSSIWPGVIFTIAAWSILTAVFTFYLSSFAAYASYYAGLAGIIAALYFMYLAALILIFGGELNRAIRIRRLARAMRGKTGDGEKDGT
ncbi:YihY/virulence factor BrkB family protein [Roseicyclus sp. F158]|uniref:YihY/virulence factor BrkB family protein n=1 Tax=Tropicimonas omnivorans TaxID=3075590 RepID=A0ABU3DG80_9RHOB|nr:YihY/virulence factor BrkB family protein [Roseicyclus sp. F158]MDT0682699.1 YihY/virulence factor BrkB family protein [Roseicyclus sp. F158]